MTGTNDEKDRPAEPPVMPTADEERAATPDIPVPGVLRWGFWVWIAAGLSGVVGAVFFMAARDRFVDAALRSDPKLVPQQVTDTAIGLSWWLLMGSLMFLGFMVLLGWKVQHGVRKARTLLITVGVFSVLMQYTIGRVTIFGLISALLGLVAAGMLFMPTVRKFFADHDAAR